jgi:hypothetical protein
MATIDTPITPCREQSVALSTGCWPVGRRRLPWQRRQDAPRSGSANLPVAPTPLDPTLSVARADTREPGVRDELRSAALRETLTGPHPTGDHWDARLPQGNRQPRSAREPSGSVARGTVGSMSSRCAHVAVRWTYGRRPRSSHTASHRALVGCGRANLQARHGNSGPFSTLRRDGVSHLRPLLRKVAMAFPHSVVELWAVAVGSGRT